jgi:hypothetical protein
MWRRGKIVTSNNFTQRDANGGKWAENLSPSNAAGSLPKETQALFSAPRTIESPDPMAKRLIKAMTSAFVSSILREADQA